jgi:hypothetical protein
MHEAHRRGVIHRDLKPANVMITRRGDPVVMDFGLARRDDATEIGLTRSGMLLGTPAYMAPEQIEASPGRVGPASDIYALGVILYQMLTARLPFQGSVMSVLRKIVYEEADPPSTYRPDLDPALEAVCLKAMAKGPEDRYTSMADLADALTEFLRTTQETPRPGLGPKEVSSQTEADRTWSDTGLRTPQSWRPGPRDTAGESAEPGVRPASKKALSPSFVTAGIIVLLGSLGFVCYVGAISGPAPVHGEAPGASQSTPPPRTESVNATIPSKPVAVPQPPPDRRAMATPGPGEPTATGPATPPPVDPRRDPPDVSPRRRVEDPRIRKVREKLEEPIAMRFPVETPLEDVLKYIQQATADSSGYDGIRIHVDPEGLRAAGKTITSPVSIDHTGIPLRTTLRLLLGQLGLTYVVRDGLVIITRQEMGEEGVTRGNGRENPRTPLSPQPGGFR